MKLARIVAELGLENLAAGDLTREVTGGYCSDLLSDVLAHVAPGELWITHQRHLNVVAVAKLRDVAGVIFAQGNRPGHDVVSRAAAEGVNLFLSERSAFEIAGRLYRLLRP